MEVEAVRRWTIGKERIEAKIEEKGETTENDEFGWRERSRH